jgi:protein-disulfide isomerase
MNSPWAYVLGLIPVSLPAGVVYLLMILCIAFLGSDTSLDRFLWPLMLFLSGCIIGAAFWFCWLQVGVLHAFCKYCTALHLLGCSVACIILFCHPELSEGSPRWPPLLAGLAAAAVFAVVQSYTKPFIYDTGRAEAELPAFEEGEVPVILSDSEESLTLLFDFQCSHCRRLHRLLPELSEQYRILLAPVPLSSACNPYIPASGIDRFQGSCQLTRLAMAVWYARPEEASAYWDFLLEGAAPDEAENRALTLLGDGFAEALADPRIEAYLRKVEELFGRTSTQGSSAVPRFIKGRHWLVPEAETADELLNLLGQL